MEQSKIDRINQLSKIARERELTPEEAAERKALREEYIADFKASLVSNLESTVIQYPDGEQKRVADMKKELH